MPKSTARPDFSFLRERRAILATLAAGALPARAQTATSRARTPTQTLGPFYPRDASERPAETDADLLQFSGERLLSRGQPLFLSGRVLDLAGGPVTDARIEIWQCDANAVYHHPAGGAESERDPHFQGYGSAAVDREGRYHFRTIRPVAYPGRTPHIHVRVHAGSRTLATQLYLPDAPQNARDFLYRQLSAQERQALALNLEPTKSSHPLAAGTEVSALVDLVLS